MESLTYTNFVAARMFTTYEQHTPAGPVYLACGQGWGPLKSRSPIDKLYFVLDPNDRIRDVATTLSAASFAAAWARSQETGQKLHIMRSDGVEVQDECDVCRDSGEAMRSPSSSKSYNYLCIDCMKERWLKGKPKRGRKKGSAIYRTQEEFRQTALPIIQQLRKHRIRISRKTVAQRWPFATSDRQIRRWEESLDITIDHIQKEH